jgi:hypothetical protein
MGPMCQSGAPEDSLRTGMTLQEILIWLPLKFLRHDITVRVLGILQHILILKIIKQIML